MKIIVATDSFKENLTSIEVANCVERGFQKIFPDAKIIKIPMADGGEGTVEALVYATKGKIIKKEVTGPLGSKVEAYFGILGDGKTAVIEMAAASGLHLVPKEKRNPLITTTRGTGELILAAVNEGIKHIIIGLGGSATNDGGVGMAKALGVKFLDKEGNLIKDGGGYLNTLHAIDTSNLDKRLENIKIEVACDVNITLTGDKGASAVFGPQKGATEEMVKTLDDNLTHFANIVSRDLKVEIKNIPGSGAAGGLGAGLIAFLGAEMKSGIDMVVSTTNLEKKMKGANLVITGEGKVDGQSFYGKTPIGVAKIAKRYNIPVIIITGNISDESGEIYNFGIDAMFSVLPRVMTLSDAYKYSRLNIERTIENIARLIKSMKLYLKK